LALVVLVRMTLVQAPPPLLPALARLAVDEEVPRLVVVVGVAWVVRQTVLVELEPLDRVLLVELVSVALLPL
jgi:hypothetical protein